MTNDIFFPRASFVGFDNLFNQLERATHHQVPQYPPHNIVKYDDHRYAIELAVAGFNMQDLDIECDKNVLTIKEKKEKTNRQIVNMYIVVFLKRSLFVNSL